MKYLLFVILLMSILLANAGQSADATHKPTPRRTATMTPSKTATATARPTSAPTHTPFCRIVRSYIGGQGTLVNQWTCVDEYPAVTRQWNVVLPAGVTPH